MTNFELACEVAALICAADLVWLLHDILLNGMSIWYGIIGTGLTVGFVGILIVIYRHHKVYTNRLLSKISKKGKSIDKVLEADILMDEE